MAPEDQNTSNDQFEGLSADRRARLQGAKDDAEPSPQSILPSRPRASTAAATRELSSSPDASPTPNTSSKGRAEQLAEQGWVEKIHHGRHGRTKGWSIHRINGEASPKESKPESTPEEPILRQPSPTKSNEAAGFLSKYNGRDTKVLREHYGQIRINGVHVEEYSLVMRNMAMKNRKDREFQDRFAATLAKHNGKKVSAKGGTVDAEGACYDADTSFISENGDGYRTPRDEDMGYVGGNYHHSSGDHITKEREDHKEKRGPAESHVRHGNSNDDGDISDFDAARASKRTSGFREAYKEREEKLAKLSADIAEYKRMDEKYRLDIVRNNNGEEMPRWVKYRKDKQKLDKLLKKQGKGFYERFDSILTKHEKKSEKLGHTNGDVEMADEGTMGDNRSEYRNKRKRDVDDEDTMMESMKHMRVESGRKRSRNVDRNDFPADLAKELSHRCPDPRPDRSSRGRSMDRSGRPSGDSYRQERSFERRPAYHGVKEDLASHRVDRRGREGDYRDDRSAEKSHRDRRERDRDFVSFLDPRVDAFDNRGEERSQGKYWKGFDRGEQNDNSTYRGIADNFNDYRESRKHDEGHRADSRRRSESPRSTRDLPETIPLSMEGDEQAQWWGEEEKLQKRYKFGGQPTPQEEQTTRTLDLNIFLSRPEGAGLTDLFLNVDGRWIML